MVRPHIAEFLIEDIYGDASMPNDSNQRNILNRIEAYTPTGDDISVDLQENSGIIQVWCFWKIVAAHSKKKLQLTTEGTHLPWEMVTWW